MDLLAQNKQVVLRFNREVLEQFHEKTFKEIMHPDFTNRTATAYPSDKADGVAYMIKDILHVAFPDLKVEILEQVAERDLITTRKLIRATHLGPIMGIAPTGKSVSIEVMEMIRIKDGKYFEHWGYNNLSSVLASLKA